MNVTEENLEKFDLVASWQFLSLQERFLISFEDVWGAWEAAKSIGDIPEIILLHEEIMNKADGFCHYKKMLFEKGFFDGMKEREDVFWKALVDSVPDFDEAFCIYSNIFSEKRKELGSKILESVKNPSQMVKLVHHYKGFWSHWPEIMEKLLPYCSLSELADYIKSSRAYLDYDNFIDKAKDLSIEKIKDFDDCFLLANLFKGYSDRHFNLVFSKMLKIVYSAPEKNFQQMLHVYLFSNDEKKILTHFYYLTEAAQEFSDWKKIWFAFKDNLEAKKYLISIFPDVARTFDDYLWIWNNIPEIGGGVKEMILSLADSYEKFFNLFTSIKIGRAHV